MNLVRMVHEIFLVMVVRHEREGLAGSSDANAHAAIVHILARDCQWCAGRRSILAADQGSVHKLVDGHAFGGVGSEKAANVVFR